MSAKKLTARQLKFVAKYVETGNGSQAAIAAGFSVKGAGVQANRMLKKANVAAEIAKVRKPVVEAAQITLASHLKTLAELRDAAKDANQYAPAITAEVNRGKASGLYLERLEVSGEIEVLAFRRRSEITA